MKQIVQNYRKGLLTVEEVPEPALRSGGLLVQTHHSLISSGTEKMKIDDAQRSYLGMARARPDKVKQVLSTLKQLGPLATFRKVMNRLDSLTPLGYSLAGRVIAVGDGVTGFNVGDLIACGGGELATHAEINWVPENLCCRIPQAATGVLADPEGYLTTEQSAFATVGAIAMQGVRQARVQVGENVAVIGLGLVGLLCCQILKASGCRVLGLDIDPMKISLAQDIGIDKAARTSDVDPEELSRAFSGGIGMDAVIIATGTKSNEPIVSAGVMARDRATIVDVGINKMDIPWQLYYGKELVLKQSRSYGPGRYDPNYESKGHDYPVGYVRWTENRNMLSFLELMASGKIDVLPLITHRFAFQDAAGAYELISGKSSEFYVAIVLAYDTSEANTERARTRSVAVAPLKSTGGIGLGVIGAGNFARTMLLPHLRADDVHRVAVAAATGISAKDTARKFGFDRCSTDYRELLQDEAIDTVLIATRHDLHGKLVLEALQAGKHVYTEKPLCMNEDELAEIARAYQPILAGDDPRLLMVGFNRRFSSLIRQMKSFFEPRQEPMILHYRVNAGFMAKDSWYQDKDVGGGRIIGEVCHFIDTLQFLTAAAPCTVFAQAIDTDNRATTLQDNIIVTVGFSDGSIGAITYLANGDPAFPKEYIEAFCENKVAVMNNFAKLTTMAKGRKKVTRAKLPDKGHKAEMQAFTAAVAGKAEIPIPFESLRDTTLATFAVLESLAGRRLVEVGSRFV